MALDSLFVYRCLRSREVDGIVREGYFHNCFTAKINDEWHDMLTCVQC